MAKQVQLKVKTRTEIGKGPAKRMRSTGVVPGVVYGAKTKPVSVTVDSFEGLRYALKFGEGNGDNLPAEISVEVTGDPAAPPAPAPVEGEKPEEAAAKAMEAATKARDEKVAQAAKLQSKQVFIPRKFLEPFLGTRSFLLAAPAPPAPTPAPTPRKKR